MIMILGTLVYNDDTSIFFFHCFEIFTVWAASKVKGQEIAQNEKQLHHLPYLRNSKGYNHDFFYTSVKW